MGSRFFDQIKIVRMLLALVAVLICTNATPESDAPRDQSAATEHATLRALHDTLLELQVTELSFKNRRDAALERDLTNAVDQARAIREFALRHREELPQLLEESSREAHALLHEAFGARRYGLYSRLESARRMLLRLELMDSAIGVPEEIAAMYNQILDNLYAFGISVSPGESSALQGVLFGPSPQEASVRYERLRYHAGAGVGATARVSSN